MTVKQVKARIEKLVDEIDDYLCELEYQGKDNTYKYDELLDIAGSLREIVG